MPLQANTTSSEGEGEWIVVDQEWWRTPFDSISWSYPSERLQEGSAPSTTSYAKPPYYHDILLRSPKRRPDSHRFSKVQGPTIRVKGDVRMYEDDDTELNSELVGVKAAGDVIAPYEAIVGFYRATESHPATSPSTVDLLCNDVKETDVLHGRELWEEMVQKLTGGFVLGELETESDDASPTGPCFSDFSPMSSSLHSTTSTLSSIDLGGLDLPLTPKATYGHVAVHKPSSVHHTGDGQLPSRLNASASTFVPSSFHPNGKPQTTPSRPGSTSHKSSMPSLSGFTFPTIDRPTSVKITKDDQGFVTEVEVAESANSSSSSAKPNTSSTPAAPQQQRLSTALLPLFLHEPNTRRKAPASKTRAIVDKLRSSANNQSQSKEYKDSDWMVLGKDLRLPGEGARAKSASISPAPSPSFELSDFLKPRVSVSEDGDERYREKDGDSLALESVSLEPDEEGWFSLGDSQPDQDETGRRSQCEGARSEAALPTKANANTNDKAKRAQALFLALNRHRTGSASPSAPDAAAPSLSIERETREEEKTSKFEWVVPIERSSSPIAPSEHLTMPRPSTSLSLHQKRAESRASSSSPSKKPGNNKRSSPSSSTHPQYPKPLSIAIPPPYQPFAVPPPSISVPLTYATPPLQLLHPHGVGVVPTVSYMPAHSHHSYFQFQVGMPTPINHYLRMQMQMQLQLQMQGIVPPPSVLQRPGTNVNSTKPGSVPPTTTLSTEHTTLW